jgi:dihydrofolate reductase
VRLGDCLDDREAESESAPAPAAGGGKDVGVWGGANVIRQYLKAGLLDERQIHLVPIVLGGGVRLFEDLDTEGIELRRTSSIETPGATHFRCRRDVSAEATW